MVWKHTSRNARLGRSRRRNAISLLIRGANKTHTHTHTHTNTHTQINHTHTHTHTNKHTHIHTYTHTHTDTSKASIVCLKYYTIYYSKDYYASYEYYDPITDYVITNNLLLRTFYYFGFNRTINPQ